MAGYGTNNAFRDFAAAAGYVIPDDATDPQIAAARQRGALVIDRYEPRFSGRRTVGLAQERAWPRAGASTHWGEPIASDQIPEVVINASYEAAWLELTNPGSLSPVITGSSQVKREKIDQLEIEYGVSQSTNIDDIVALATPVVTIIEGMLWPLLMPVLPGILVV